MDDEHMRQRLTEERDRLSTIRNDLEASRLESQEDGLQELSSYDQHQADVGTETFEREKDLSILQEVEGELADIEHALQRLDDGTYGTCEACGKPIGDDRLEAIPAARFCLEDQAEAERESRSATASGVE
ncbi:MAG: TraR/DksA C4-type zinc finger protein [Actinomycetota bacterium]|nr:TraR/DksA C4-type zinc finger protein [Actinomycetota bacterium]